MTAKDLIAALRMERIPHEGAWFAPTFRGPNSAYSAIYGLATAEDFSAFHRLSIDELWHYYAGSPLELVLLHPDGRGERVLLGSDIGAGEKPQVLVPAGVWQGARPIGGSREAYTLFGNTLTPGFDPAHYEPGRRSDLLFRYPAFAEAITGLTRSG